MSAFWILLIIHILIISFHSTDCIVPELHYDYLPEVSTVPGQRMTFYNRGIRNPDDLEKMFRDSGIPIVIQREFFNKDFSIRDIETDNPPNTSEGDSSGGGIDPWSIVWYIGSFGGLIAFFLVVSCSEWCCARNRNSNRTNGRQSSRNPVTRCQQQQVLGTPPPAYHLFAPPSYDTCSLDSEKKTNKFDVYVVPVHTDDVEFSESKNSIEQPPPDYTAVDIPPA